LIGACVAAQQSLEFLAVVERAGLHARAQTEQQNES
jgi:hypothetical protein